MILSDRTLREAIASGRIGVDPFDDAMIQPSSLDVRIDSSFRVFRNHTAPLIDVKKDMRELTELVEIAHDGVFVLHPGEFVLGSTLEYLTMPTDLVARVEGKALGVGTPIPTPEGWATIDSLRVSDRVFGRDGQPVGVKDVSEILLGRPCFEVEFADGETLIADAAHQWLTSTRTQRAHGEHAVVTTEAIAAALRRGGEDDHHVPVAAPIECPDAVLPVDPYVLGVWLGAGTSTSAEITTADPEVLLELRRRGVPRRYLRASIEQRFDLLRGLMDADGQCDESGRCGFTTIDHDLAEAVHELVAGLGFLSVIAKKPAMPDSIDHGPLYDVTFTPDRPGFALSRQHHGQPVVGRLERSRQIRAVRPVASIPVRCIEVDAPDGVYLAGRSFIPTHNSSLGRLGLLIHQTAGFVDPGFEGHITLELANVASLPITIYPTMKIGQLSFMTMTTPADKPYGDGATGSKYRGQRGPTPSRYFENFGRPADGAE